MAWTNPNIYFLDSNEFFYKVIEEFIKYIIFVYLGGA